MSNQLALEDFLRRHNVLMEQGKEYHASSEYACLVQEFNRWETNLSNSDRRNLGRDYQFMLAMLKRVINRYTTTTNIDQAIYEHVMHPDPPPTTVKAPTIEDLRRIMRR